MADDDRHVPHFGEDYDLDRWAEWNTDRSDYLRNEEGNIVWHDTYPANDDWDRVSMVTVNIDPESPDGDFRNVEISPDRPLDPWGEYDPSDEYWYDLDDLIGEVLNGYGIDY